MASTRLRMSRMSRRSKRSRRSRRNTLRRRRSYRVSRFQKGGSVLDAPDGSVVIVRDNGDKYSPFVAIGKKEAEKADF